MKFAQFIIFALLIHIGSLDFFAINFDDTTCLNSYEKLKFAYSEFSDNKFSLDLSLKLLTSTKNTYKNCLKYSVELPLSLKKSMDSYNNLGDAFSALVNFIKNNSDNSSLAINEIIKGILNKDYDRIQYVMRILLNSLISQNAPNGNIQLTKPDFTYKFKQINEFIENFIKYSGIISPVNSCTNSMENIIKQLFESFYSIYKLENPLQGIEKLLSIDTILYEISNNCPTSQFTSIWQAFMNADWVQYYQIFNNVMNRSGLIGSNGFNAYMAIMSKNWGKAGAWLGLVVFNAISPTI